MLVHLRVIDRFAHLVGGAVTLSAGEIPPRIAQFSCETHRTVNGFGEVLERSSVTAALCVSASLTVSYQKSAFLSQFTIWVFISLKKKNFITSLVLSVSIFSFIIIY